MKEVGFEQLQVIKENKSVPVVKIMKIFSYIVLLP